MKPDNRPNFSIRTGIDICDPARIEKAIRRHGERFLVKIYTPSEIEYCSSLKNPYASFAARFAVKEAVMKLLGYGIGKIGFTEVETLIDPEGRPSIVFTGKTKKIVSKMGIESVDISLSHEKALAVAVVVALAHGA